MLLAEPRSWAMSLLWGTFLRSSFDGWNNNKVHPLWGAAGQLMRRFESSQYGDGFSRPGGADRPNPRVISTSVMNAVGFGAHDDGKMPLNGNRILCLVPQNNKQICTLRLGSTLHMTSRIRPQKHVL